MDKFSRSDLPISVMGGDIGPKHIGMRVLEVKMAMYKNNTNLVVAKWSTYSDYSRSPTGNKTYLTAVRNTSDTFSIALCQECDGEYYPVSIIHEEMMYVLVNEPSQ